MPGGTADRTLTSQSSHHIFQALDPRIVPELECRIGGDRVFGVERDGDRWLEDTPGIGERTPDNGTFKDDIILINIHAYGQMISAILDCRDLLRGFRRRAIHDHVLAQVFGELAITGWDTSK